MVGLLADRLQVGRLRGLAPSYLTDELHHLADRVGVSKAFRFVPVPIPDSQPTATELLQSPPFASGTVLSVAVTSRLRLLHSLEDITSSNSVIHNRPTFVVPAK